MKLINFIYAIAGLSLAASMTGCEGEKDLVIIEGNLPIKTSTLYMVGDATPNGWSIDSPTPLETGTEDPLVFTWEGNLNKGEMKLCLTTGSFDAPFIRPAINGAEIGKTEIVDAEFKMHAGDPDDKWKVVEPGVYRLSFDLRNWTMSSLYIKGQDEPVKEPIAADALYIIGDATPNGWNVDAPTMLSKTSEYIYEYEGLLNAGEMKAFTSTGSWDVPFVRPLTDGCKISENGVESTDFLYVTNPDNKWKVTTAGTYHLTFDLEKWTITAEFKGGMSPEKEPLESNTLYMIGDATPGGWSMDNATAFTQSPDNKYIFTWEGDLVQGNMKACLEPDGTFSCPFIRPVTADVEISSNGVSSSDFVYTKSPDDQWKVVEAGKYRITFDLEHWSITVKSLTEGGGSSEKEPLESNTLYMIGDATPNGWSMDNATAFTQSPDNKYVFTWEGDLVQGDMKACLEPDGTFSCPFLRPAFNGCKINANGVENSEFIYTKDPDDKWRVDEAGKYRLVFDLQNWTFQVTKL